MPTIEAMAAVPADRINCDNGGEFINEALIGRAGEQGLFFTRARPYHSNDNASIRYLNRSSHPTRSDARNDRAPPAMDQAVSANASADATPDPPPTAADHLLALLGAASSDSPSLTSPPSRCCDDRLNSPERHRSRFRRALTELPSGVPEGSNAFMSSELYAATF